MGGEEERFIEVKGIGGNWHESRGVIMTEREFDEAVKRRENYWLYVVERVDTNEPEIHPIKNPFDKIGEYGFDHGWQALSGE